MNKIFLFLLLAFIFFPALLCSASFSPAYSPLILRWKMLALHSQQEKLSTRELIPIFNDPNKDPNGKATSSKIFPTDLENELDTKKSEGKKDGGRRILQNFPWNSNSNKNDRNPNGKEYEYQKMFSELQKDNYKISHSRNKGDD